MIKEVKQYIAGHLATSHHTFKNQQYSMSTYYTTVTISSGKQLSPTKCNRQCLQTPGTETSLLDIVCSKQERFLFRKKKINF